MVNQRFLEVPAVSSASDLMAALRGIDVVVPKRTEGRKTFHVERRTICHLMSTLAEAAMLEYPVSLQHRDRPDFFLHCGGARVGIEATEAISEQYAAYTALAERESPDAFLEPGHFKRGMPDLTLEEKRALLRRNSLTAEPWIGDIPEQDWASHMAEVVKTKTEKLAKPEFDKFPENWLLIYDNLPMPHVRPRHAVNLLAPMLHRYWGCSPAFAAIFIEHNSIVVKISSKEITYLSLKNLW